MVSLDVVNWINVGLAGSGALVAFGSLNRMGNAQNLTRAIRCAFVTTCAGLFGEALSTALPQHWQGSIDTVLFGGVLGLLVASRRRPVFISEVWASRVSLTATLSTWALFFLGVRT